MAVLQNAGDAAKGELIGRKGGSASGRGTNAYKIVKMIMERNFAPVICFSFSKKDCESYALQMSKLDFNTVEEKKLVDEVFNNAMDVLNEEDRKLPQVENVLPLLRRGIGIHHGGLLPILKETIEILFAEGLIKALFATETFAMGLNMPARTVLFTGCRKFDGKDYRFVSCKLFCVDSIIIMISTLFRKGNFRRIYSDVRESWSTRFGRQRDSYFNDRRASQPCCR